MKAVPPQVSPGRLCLGKRGKKQPQPFTWMQIVGKTRLAFTPRENHWWNVPLYVTARGLSTSTIPFRDALFDVEFDFVDHQLHVRVTSGESKSIALRPQSVTAFYGEYFDLLRSFGIDAKINPKPGDRRPDSFSRRPPARVL